MIIVIEGADNSGKTTLAKDLSNVLWPWGIYMKSPGAGRGGEWEPSLDVWINLLNAIPSPFVPILDRTPEVAEFVYSWADVKEQRICRSKKLIHSMRSWMNLDIRFILATHNDFQPGEQTVLGKQINEEEHRRIQSCYSMITYLLNQSGISVRTFDYAVDDFDNLYAWIDDPERR